MAKRIKSDKKCSILNCYKKHYARSYCFDHYKSMVLNPKRRVNGPAAKKNSLPELVANHKVGRLTLISESDIKNKDNRTMWKVRCDCGKELLVPGKRLKPSPNQTLSCGCLKADLMRERTRVDISGQKFGMLLVVSLDEEKTRRVGKSHFQVLCDCGNKKSIVGASLIQGLVKSCGCLDKRRYQKPGEAGFKKLFSMYRSSAKKRNILWDLTEADFYKLIVQDCFYCGSKPIAKTVTHLKNEDHKKNAEFYGTGIDRKDPYRGYFLENCVPACTVCNKSKLLMSSQQFLEHLAKIAAYQASKG